MKIVEIKKINQNISNNLGIYNNFDDLTIMFWIKLSENRNYRQLLLTKNPNQEFAIILEKSASNQISFYCGNNILYGPNLKDTKFNFEFLLYKPLADAESLNRFCILYSLFIIVFPGPKLNA